MAKKKKMDIKPVLIAGVIVLIALAVSFCQLSGKEEEPQIAVEVVDDVPEPVVEEEPVEEEPEDLVPNPEITELFERMDSVKSYSFTSVLFPDKTTQRGYSVRDGKAKIKLVRPLDFDGWSADYVYLDLDAETATAYCIDYTTCKEDEVKESVSFEEYIVPMPKEWVERLQYGEKTKSLTFDRRPVTVVQWNEGDLWYEAYVDNYYGFPVHVSIANNEEMTDLVSVYEYREMAFNNVDEEEVTPPY